jgi:hypothetical protein
MLARSELPELEGGTGIILAILSASLLIDALLRSTSSGPTTNRQSAH